MPTRIDPFPHLHVRPTRGWVNDPNGIGHWDGRWHVMFQWNPSAPQHRDVHWGHMSSADLLTWRDEGVALRPRPGSIDAVGVWSGVAVPGADGVALVYTAVPDHARNASVAVARPGASGEWVQPDHTATDHPDHSRWREVRDPFVVSVAGRRLGIMGAGLADRMNLPRGGAVLVYDATELDRWTLLGPLVTAVELPTGMVGAGAIWECPMLLPLADRWLLVVSWDDGGGSQGTAAYIGDLDVSGTTPRFFAATETALDGGPDFYAPQLVADGQRVLAWAWSWEGRGTDTNRRSDDDIAASGWAGVLTFPREIVIDASGRAKCIPARELDGLVGERIEVQGAPHAWEAQTSAPAWTFVSDSGAALDLVDESTGHTRSVWRADGPGPTRVFIDGSIVEAFTSNGSATVRAYPLAGERWRVRSVGRLTASGLRAP